MDEATFRFQDHTNPAPKTPLDGAAPATAGTGDANPSLASPTKFSHQFAATLGYGACVKFREIETGQDMTRGST